MTNSINKLFAGFILTISFAGCSSDEAIVTPADNQAITFSTNVTRASGTTWEAGDGIGVYMKVHSDTPWEVVNGGVNVSYTTTKGDGYFTATNLEQALKYPDQNKRYDFIAYYPYTSSVTTDGVYKVDVSDQKTPSNIDLLYAETENIPATSTANNTLTFTHKLASLTLNITSKDGRYLDDGLNVTVTDVPATADFNLKDATFSNPATATNGIPMYVTPAGTSATAKALLIPSEKTTTVTARISDGKQSKDIKLATDKGLESGKNYTFNINVTGIGEKVNIPTNYKERTETPYISPEQWNNPAITYNEYFSGTTTRSTEAAGSDRNYSLLYDTSKKMALWVAYPLNGSYTGSIKRPDNWSYDPNSTIPRDKQINVVNGSYKERGNPSYDRGHQIPNGDRNGNQEMQLQTFYVTNQTPQISAMNQGIWVRLEDKVREWAPKVSTDTLFVVTGPIFDTTNVRYATDQSNQKIEVPASYFKVIAHVTRDASGKVTNAKTLGFIIPNTDAVAKDDFMKYARSVKEVEAVTKTRFFQFLTDDTYKTSTTW